MPADEDSKPQGELAGQPHGDTSEVSPPVEGQQAPTGMAIEVNGNRLEPESQMPGGDLFEETASKTNYILIQFLALPDQSQVKQLDDLQVQICHKIPPSTWLARYTPQDLSILRELPFVVFANPYHESLSLKPTLEKFLARKSPKHAFVASAIGPSTASTTSNNESDLLEVVISLHPFSRTPEEFRDYLVSKHSIPREQIFVDFTTVRTSLTSEQVLRISKIDDVAEVHLLPKLKLNSHLVDIAVRASDAGIVASQVYPELELDGKGQIIAIADTGLDNWLMAPRSSGSSGSTDPALNEPHPFFKGRIIYLDLRTSKVEGVWRTGKAITRSDRPEDFSGHGTHVAGIALGSYDQMAVQSGMRLLSPRLDGVAPKAELIMQNLWGLPTWDPQKKTAQSEGRPSFDPLDLAYHTVFFEPYFGFPEGGIIREEGKYLGIKNSGKMRLPKTCAHGARIHNGSFGEGMEAGSGWSPLGKVADETVWRLPDYLLIFGAGNDGDDPEALKFVKPPDGQIMGFAAAKNVLTVGACFNGQYVRSKAAPGVPNPDHPYLWSSFQLASDGGTQVSPGNVHRMSSRGPPKGYPSNEKFPALIKPDIVAPGIAVYSAESRFSLFNHGHGVAPIPSDLATFKSGTSQAAPVVAGAAALIRQALAQRGGPFLHPSAALMKALIVQGAVDLSTLKVPGQLWAGNTVEAKGSGQTANENIGAAPNDIQGWGRLNIADSVFHAVDTTYCTIVDVKAPPLDSSSSSSSSSSSTTVLNDLGLNGNLESPHAHFRAYEVPLSPPKAARETTGGSTIPTRGHIKATLCWTDFPTSQTLQNQLALSISYKDGRAGGISVDPGKTSGNPLLWRMAYNPVQKLELRDIPLTPDMELIMVVKVEVINMHPKSGNQGFALVYRKWYT